jgi:hypothetical protein
VSQPFLICALPRSRSAWLANFLNYGEVECSHEMMSELSVNGIHRFLTLAETKFAGNSDTMQALMMPDIMREFGSNQPRILVVERPPAEVAKSLTAIGLPTTPALMEVLQHGLEYVKALPNVLVVPYHELSVPKVGEAILEHVAPGEPFNRHRFSQLCGFNVQITKSRLMKILNNVKENY